MFNSLLALLNTREHLRDKLSTTGPISIQLTPAMPREAALSGGALTFTDVRIDLGSDEESIYSQASYNHPGPIYSKEGQVSGKITLYPSFVRAHPRFRPDNEQVQFYILL